ncbi:MarR family winged helix-turn-helix transcriptional regulator [Microbacterium pumilum]|uniref:HTH marR-type domain-containing protein n=1 Tax=Microbacterium pumilum TaxID=344165 RepID=A0ABN2RRW7_9MICO
MDFFDTLVRFETALWNTVERELVDDRQVGLGTLTALRVLHRHDGRGRVQDLSRELSLTIGAASKLADRLERDGLALRRPHPTDRRSSLVSLTESGETARTAGEGVLAHALDEVLGTDEDVAVAASALKRLQARLDARS